MDYRYFRDTLGRDYYIPQKDIERFMYLVEKARNLKYEETTRGYETALEKEFNIYRVEFRKRDIWEKVTDSWQGNDDRGTLIRITSVKGDFIEYKKVNRFFSFYFSMGGSYTLNKWSFLRIFRRYYE